MRELKCELCNNTIFTKVTLKDWILNSEKMFVNFYSKIYKYYKIFSDMIELCATDL